MHLKTNSMKILILAILMFGFPILANCQSKWKVVEYTKTMCMCHEIIMQHNDSFYLFSLQWWWDKQSAIEYDNHPYLGKYYKRRTGTTNQVPDRIKKGTLLNLSIRENGDSVMINKHYVFRVKRLTKTELFRPKVRVFDTYWEIMEK